MVAKLKLKGIDGNILSFRAKIRWTKPRKMIFFWCENSNGNFSLRIHTVPNFHFCPKFNLDFPLKLSIFLGEKLVENVVVLDLLADDNFDFTRKIVKKNLGENSLKCWVFVKIELLDKNLTFRVVCNICVYAHYLNYSSHSNPDFLEKLAKETCLEYILPWKLLLLLLSLIRKVKKTAQNPQNEWWKFSRECCLSVGPNASVL